MISGLCVAWVTKSNGEFSVLMTIAPLVSPFSISPLSLDCTFHNFSNTPVNSLNSVVYQFQCPHLIKLFSLPKSIQCSYRKSQTIGQIIPLHNGGKAAIRWLPPHLRAIKHRSLPMTADIPSTFSCIAAFAFLLSKASCSTCVLHVIPTFPFQLTCESPLLSLIYLICSVIFHIQCLNIFRTPPGQNTDLPSSS